MNREWSNKSGKETEVYSIDVCRDQDCPICACFIPGHKINNECEVQCIQNHITRKDSGFHAR